MSLQKQIEEMILAVKNAITDNATIDLDGDSIMLDGNGFDHAAEQTAEALYNAGYRKQSDTAWEIVVVLASELHQMLPFKALTLINGEPVGNSFDLGRERAIYDILNYLAEIEKKYTEGNR